MKNNKRIFITLLLFLVSVNGQSLNDMIHEKFPHLRNQHRRPSSSSVYPVDQNSSPVIKQNDYQSNLSNDPRYDPRLSMFVSRSISKLGNDITNLLLHQNQGDKFKVISPLSIAAILSIVLLGSRGQTYQEILQTLGYNEDQTLSYSPYKIHEEFGLLLEDLLSDYPNPTRGRPITPWKGGNSKYNGNSQSRFNFPTDDVAPPRDAPSVIRNTNMEQSITMNQNNEIDHKIFVANGIFVQNGYTFRPDYKTAVESIYHSQLHTLDFKQNPSESVNYINNWVRDNTGGRIKGIINSPLTSDTKVVLANALYFKAQWEYTFIEGATKPKSFYPDGLGGREIQVDMMAHGGKFPHYISPEFDCQIIGIPYKRNLTTMYVILPNNSTKDKLQSMQGRLRAEDIDNMISKMTLKSAILLFPKMHLTYSLDLRSVLSQLGIRSLFSPRSSDLSLISSGYELQGDMPGLNGQNMNSYRPSAQSAPMVSTIQRNGEELFVFSRISEDNDDESSGKQKRDVTYKVESEFKRDQDPLRLKDFVLNKRITKPNSVKKLLRNRRQIQNTNSTQLLQNIDYLRQIVSGENPGLYADAILHKVDLTINEKGTEGGAATAVILTKTGTDVVMRVETPFMFLIRHDDTKLPLFFGTVFEPENN